MPLLCTSLLITLMTDTYFEQNMHLENLKSRPVTWHSTRYFPMEGIFMTVLGYKIKELYFFWWKNRLYFAILSLDFKIPCSSLLRVYLLLNDNFNCTNFIQSSSVFSNSSVVNGPWILCYFQQSTHVRNSFMARTVIGAFLYDVITCWACVNPVPSIKWVAPLQQFLTLSSDISDFVIKHIAVDKILFTSIWETIWLNICYAAAKKTLWKTNLSCT